MANTKETRVLHKMTREQAIKLLKRAEHGSLFGVHIKSGAVMLDSEEVWMHGLSTGLNISRRDAIKIVSELLSNTLEEKGWRIPITVYVYEYETIGKSTTYWIGGY